MSQPKSVERKTKKEGFSMIVQVLRHLRNIFMITTVIFGSSYFFQKNIGNDLIGFLFIGIIGSIGFFITLGLLWYLKRKETHGF